MPIQEDIQKILDNKYMKADKKYSEIANKVLKHTTDAYKFAAMRPMKATPQDWILVAATSVLPLLSLRMCCGSRAKKAKKE